ncbi:SLC13 family permease [Shumkonia mesophila]|uniref:SLC13 family permease n=1 Tax=Shumkonia mesophila TaxID=2838854 RepID=UPI002934FF25|nr:SLC13 family permease [Shumkonia mesophila]
MELDWLVIGVFVVVYLGMALGRWPGLAIDRTGVAIIGAIVLVVSGAVHGQAAFRFIDFPTIAVLFTLMVIAAQFAASGFFEWIGTGIAHGRVSQKVLLFHVVLTGGVLAALLTNDVVVWAMTPVLVQGLLRRGLNPRPYVIALACAANAGSAATVIGNPQNLLIGEYGGLGFWPFLLACGIPAAISLMVVYGVILKAPFGIGSAAAQTPAEDDAGRSAILKREPLAKALAATVALVIVFSVAEDRATWALAIAGALLLSRRLATRQMLSMVDWHLLLLFAGLFVVTGALGARPALIPGVVLAPLSGGPYGTEALAAVALAGSNTIGNVPLVVFLLSVTGDWTDMALYSLALFSTLSGNFLIVGSVANIIAVERARALGVTIGFVDYAKIGVPVTVLSLLAAYAWIRLVYPPFAAMIGT